MIEYPCFKGIKLTKKQAEEMQQTANNFFNGNVSALIRHIWANWKGKKNVRK